MGECWRVVPRLNLYEVSDFGRVRRIDSGRILKAGISNKGYLVVSLWAGNVQVGTPCVHQLVAEAFLGIRPDGYEVAHLDGCRSNPRLDNLAYVTHVENESHKREHGTDNRGSKNPNSKLSEARVLEMRCRREAGERLIDLAAEYGVARSVAARAINGVTWRHVA